MDKKEMRLKGIERFREERDWYNFLIEQMKLVPTEEMELSSRVTQMVVDAYDRMIACVEEDKPFIASYFCCAPEIYTAMDIPWYMLMQTPFLSVSFPFLMDDVDNSVKMGLGTDLCTALRLSIYYVEAGITPPPHAIIGLLYPCDGAPMLHQIVAHNKDWRDIPHFACDPPYFDDERSIQYFAQELRRMVSFVEEHTGHTLDMDRLKEVIEESNKQYALWAEYNELRRAVPCPHGYGLGGGQCFAITQVYRAGHPEGTQWFRDLVEHTERRVQAGLGGMPVDERIRLLWFDIRPVAWLFEVLPWLEEEWGANIVMDMFAYTPYKTIDTSSEDSMFAGLAERNLLHSPMIRQARGVADNFINDIVRIVKDYKIDCVIWPGHMGHKDGSASIGMMREVCRDLSVPFLTLGLDLFDSRYMKVDEMKDKLSQFFTAMGLG
ncbi:MAG: 2-hydroxyacyl-CoA dehydratase [Chloroflexi bacterium]|nr:2-hydroxyacyl-CoA dehydratase [Chloroflexota bacterium]